jgi:hypothetical protein
MECNRKVGLSTSRDNIKDEPVHADKVVESMNW